MKDEIALVKQKVAEICRAQSHRLPATLIRPPGDFDLAEHALQEAFRAAIERWPREGLPRSPFAWLVSTGRFKGIDSIRRRARRDQILAEIAAESTYTDFDPTALDIEVVGDDQLRFIFTCCHPSLPRQGRIALVPREVCGLTTPEIARAFLVTPETMTRRISRAKEQIQSEQIPYRIRSRHELGERLNVVLQMVSSSITRDTMRPRVMISFAGMSLTTRSVSAGSS